VRGNFKGERRGTRGELAFKNAKGFPWGAWHSEAGKIEQEEENTLLLECGVWLTLLVACKTKLFHFAAVETRQTPWRNRTR
jgi:hypothetical protein